MQGGNKHERICKSADFRSSTTSLATGRSLATSAKRQQFMALCRSHVVALDALVQVAGNAPLDQQLQVTSSLW